MVLKFNDPYKSREYAIVKGDKKDSFSSFKFDEATIHPTDDGFIVYGNMLEYQGVVRSFKPEVPIEPGICAVPFFSKEYEVRKKDLSGNWISEKEQPSRFEVAVCKLLTDYQSTFVGDGKAVTGSITHLPDAMCLSADDAALAALVTTNVQINAIPATGKIPEFKAPYSAGQRKGGNWSKGLSPDERVAFLIKQMETDVKSTMHKSGQCLADLTSQLILEHADNENFIEIYFDMLIACVR